MGEGRDEGRDVNIEIEEQRAVCEIKLLLIQSLLSMSDKNVQERFLHAINISGDLCGHIILYETLKNASKKCVKYQIYQKVCYSMYLLKMTFTDSLVQRASLFINNE